MANARVSRNATLWLVVCAIVVGQHAVTPNILVYTPSQLLIEEFRDMPALFGPRLTSGGLQVFGVAGEPIDGCESLNPAPNTTLAKYAVILARGTCNFEKKVRSAQRYGYDAVIVHNVGSNSLEPMSAKDGSDILIPSVFVGEQTGQLLIDQYQFSNDFFLVLNNDLPFDINTHLLLPFSIFVALCFVIMIGFMVVKCMRDRRRMHRHRLPRSALKAIPIVKFNKLTMTYETCIICLDDYEDGDKLRVLPCDHAYHSKCIDVWLTKNRRVCPICKRKVLAKRNPNRRPAQQNRHSDDSQSDTDADDTTPLLNPVENTTSSSPPSAVSNHGTFTPNANASQPRVNPFDRTPNLPANLLNQTPSASIASRILRYFRLSRTESDAENSNIIEHSPVDVHQFAPGAASAPRVASTNILNANLSGSFQDSDDELITSIYEPSESASSVPRPFSDPQPSSSSHQARIGVVAIPNTEFSPSPPPSRRPVFKPSNDFIV